MARNGSGNFSINDGIISGPGVCAQQKAAAIKVTASRMDNILDDIAVGLSGSIAANGETTVTANLPMSGYKHTNVAAATSRTDYARASQVQDDALCWAGSSGGSANAYTATLSPAPTALVAGMRVRFLANHTNTGAATLNLNGLGATAIRIKRNSAVALGANAILANQVIEVIYDGSFWRLLSDGEGIVLWSPTLTCEAPMSISGSGNSSYYRRRGNQCFYWLNIAATTSGSSSGVIYFSTPFNIDGSTVSCGSGEIGFAGAYALSASATTIGLRYYNASNFGLGTFALRLSGSFEVA